MIRVHWSGINYKDALAATRAAPIVRRPPLVGGIDLAGIVESSTDAGRVARATRCSSPAAACPRRAMAAMPQYARVPAEAVVALPATLDLRSAMAIGTAGFAAALAVMQLERNGLVPGQRTGRRHGRQRRRREPSRSTCSPRRGHEVVALTRKPDAGRLPAADSARARCCRPVNIGIGSRPLEAERWAGAIDNVGGAMLGGLLRSTRSGGSVAAVGSRAATSCNVSLMPFLLRGVNLLGVNSAATPRPKRLEVWRRIASDLLPRHLDRSSRAPCRSTELPDGIRRLS